MGSVSSPHIKIWTLDLCLSISTFYKTVNCRGRSVSGLWHTTKVPAKFELRMLQLHVTCCYTIQRVLRLPDHQHGPFTFFIWVTYAQVIILIFLMASEGSIKSTCANILTLHAGDHLASLLSNQSTFSWSLVSFCNGCMTLKVTEVNR